MNKMIVIITLCTTFIGSFCWAADENQIKYWLGNQKITVEHRNFLPDKKVNIDPSNISSLKTIDKKTSLNVGWSITTLVVTFNYMYGAKIIPYTAVITYTWFTAKVPPSADKLETIIVYKS